MLFLHGIGAAPAKSDMDFKLNDVAVELALPLEPAPSQLEQKDFPHITFWSRRDWSSRRNESDKVFIETEDGNVVSDSRMNDMRKYARSLWEIFLDEGAAPPTWGEAAPNISQRYRDLMCDEFPELRFCEKNWKADYIATIHYPSWHRYQVKMNKSKKRKMRSRSVIRIHSFIVISYKYFNP